YGGSKPYIARITGRDPKFGFCREFLAAERSASKSGRTASVTAKVTEAGLYEIADTSERGKDKEYRVVLEVQGQTIECPVSSETTMEIAAALEEGRAVTDLDPEMRDGRWRLRDTSGALRWRAGDTARQRAIEQIRSLMAEHGISTDEIGGGK
ncbi:hypothetical protein, partial [Pelomicrobium sp. G1]|uniref:hypothetical protein n=1 Tax=Pelomicrobium sp. G1 TaxID=3452920 RepID=UPI003F7598CB